MKKAKLMRDSFLERIYELMAVDPNIFILSDDMGAPVIDKIREEFSDRFINVGIAEQNMINVACGLALEGFNVITYGIAPFFMRAYEQIRVNLAITGQLRLQNVNMVGVGCGVSYDVSGPTHHCLEDLSAMRSLPNLEVFSPCDWVCSGKFADFAVSEKKSKYIRFDGKKLDAFYDETESFDFAQGYKNLRNGGRVCLVTTGYATRIGNSIAEHLKEAEGINVGHTDVFMLGSFNKEKLFSELSKYDMLISLEEGFIGRSGLDCLIENLLREYGAVEDIGFKKFGFANSYLFAFGSREYLYNMAGCGSEEIMNAILNFSNEMKGKNTNV
jgi:transketolase